MAKLTQKDLDGFSKAVNLLRLYRRAEMETDGGKDLIKDLYVDPLPANHVLEQMRRPATTLIVGRKGTGKSTVFLRARHSLRSDRSVIAAYVDIKTVYEAAAGAAEFGAGMDSSLNRDSVAQLMLATGFIQAVVRGIQEDVQKQLKTSWRSRVAESFNGSYSDLERKLADYVASLDAPDFVSVQGTRSNTVRETTGDVTGSQLEASGAVGLTTASVGALASTSRSQERSSAIEYSELLMRVVDITKLISGLNDLLRPLGYKHLYVFVDDFSELPEPAMRIVVDTLIAPLNNWSNELVKFKIAAYPGRVYYGALDKSKLDEIALDLHSIYGSTSVGTMEEKSSDFTRRLLEVRLSHFGLDATKFFVGVTDGTIWETLFQASMGNPRTLGYILYFAYESNLIYGKRITSPAIRDAAKRYYEEKIEPYFNMGAFLHESFGERSTIFSLKELLEVIVSRARALRNREGAAVFRNISGRPPTSHFNIDPVFDTLLSTLELNFFITKYFEQSNRDGKRVSIYALNLGLCEKYTITFGRPTGQREHRHYFIQRLFDYNPILQGYVSTNQEIRCDQCQMVFESDFLESLKRFKMRCPECGTGTCIVTNIARKYSDLIDAVTSEQLLPATELGILRSLDAEGGPLLPRDIAGDLDVSYQLIGRRAKNLDEQNLIERRNTAPGQRRQYLLTDQAKTVYFSGKSTWSLKLDEVTAAEESDPPSQ